MEKYLQSSYLYALKNIPGDTRVAKHQAIGRISQRIAANIQGEWDFAREVAKENVPSTLVPLIKTIVGVKIKSNAFVLEALKSEDWHLIREALRARWFYHVNNESITNYKYYFRKILPFISVSTRRQIAKKLARVFSDKHHLLGQHFFDGFASEYGSKEALYFLPCCGGEFINDAIIRHKIALSNNMLKTIFYRYPESAIRYLRYLDPYDPLHKIDEVVLAMFSVIDASQYGNFLPLLLKEHPELFIMIQQQYHVRTDLGKKRTRMLVRDSKDLFIKNSIDVVDILPRRVLYNNLTLEEFETMFGNALNTRFEMINIDDMLTILEYYPKEKRSSLFIDKVKTIHGHDLLNEIEKMTVKFIELLPTEQRYMVARKIIESESKPIMGHRDGSEVYWWIYLPVDEAVSSLKIQIDKAISLNRRRNLYGELIYTCKLHDDFEMLLEVLRYADEEKPYEKSELLFHIIDRIAQEFDLEKFDERYWKHTYGIIKRMKFIKAEGREYWVLVKILKSNVHYFIDHNLPTEDIIELIIELFIKGRVGLDWNLLNDRLECQRLYLKTCLKNDYWKEMSYKQNFVEGIYSFNTRFELPFDSPDRLSLRDFPDLLKVFEERLKNNSQPEVPWMDRAKELLKIHEPELCLASYSTQKKIQVDRPSNEIITTEDNHYTSTPERSKIGFISEALVALRDFNKLKENWKKYYECCCIEIHSTSTSPHPMVKRFLKLVRWYNDVPIKFVQICLEQTNMDILGYLLDGKTFSQIALQLLPNKSDKDYDTSYLTTAQIVTTIRNVLPPISTDLVENYLGAYHMYCFGDYISGGIRLWKIVGHRRAPDKVMALSINLAKVRLYAKRQAIRTTRDTIPRKKLADFYFDMWNKNTHNQSLRVMLACYIGKIFVERPNDDTWQLVKHCVESIPDGQDNILNEVVKQKHIPVEYTSLYTQLVFDKILYLVKRGVTNVEAVSIFMYLFESLIECNEECNVPESMHNHILQYFFLNLGVDSQCCHRFIAKVYLCSSSVNLKSRVVHLSKLLVEASERWHRLPIVERNKTFSVVDSFLLYLVRGEKCNEDMKIAQGLKDMFAKNFQIDQHIGVQITLFFCIEFIKAGESFKNFGINVSRNFNLLLEKYDPIYCFLMIDLLQDFIMSFRAYNFSVSVNRRMAFIEGLIESDEQIGLIIAAKFLKGNVVTDLDCNCNYLYDMLIKKTHPIAMSLL